MSGFSHSIRLSTMRLAAALLALTACAPATQSSRANGPVRQRYRYNAVIDRSYNLASVGLPGTREMQALTDWWVSVTLEPVGADSLRVYATIDSSQFQLAKKIPEVTVEFPPTLGQGGHVEGMAARHGGGAGLRAVTAADSALLDVLPIIVPELAPAPSDVTEGDAAADTTYAARRARRVTTAPAGLPDFVKLFMKFRAGTQAFTLSGEEVSGVQGTSTRYFDQRGTLLGVRLQRRAATATKVSLQGMSMTIRGSGAEAIRVDLLP